MKTSTPKPQAPKWLLIDAEGQVLGRLASRVALLLRGKHKPAYSPHQACGDHVIIINAEKLSFTPAKFRRKTYYAHSGYLGHLKATPLQKMFEEAPAELITHSIRNMLPQNRLRPVSLKRLHVFTGATHTFEAQKPVAVDLHPQSKSPSSR